MTPFVSFLILAISLSLLLTSQAQDRAPHGLLNENPVAFSPSAYDFFHPKTQEPNSKDPCASSLPSCSPLPLAAQVASTRAQENQVPTAQKGGSRLRAGAVVGILFGLAFAVLVALGAYYVLATRRSDMNGENPVKFDA